MLGIAGRLRQHDAVLKLGYQEVLKRRQMGRQTRVGLVHVVASHPRSDAFFTCMNRYPQFLNCEPLDVKAKFLAVMSESLNVVAMESLDPQILTRQQHYVQQSVILAQLLLGSVRRRDGIKGVNRVLPWTQNCGLGRRKDFSSDPTSPCLYQYLVQFFQRTRRAALSDEDINVVRQTFDFNLSNFTVRGWYAAVLNDFGLSYLRGSTQRSSIPEVCFYDSRLLANPCAGVVKYISRMELYSRTSDGTYIFDMRRFDWTIASCFAKLEAHDDEKHLYTPKFLQTMFFGKKLECQSAPRGQFGPHATSIGHKLQIRQNFEFFLGVSNSSIFFCFFQG